MEQSQAETIVLTPEDGKSSHQELGIEMGTLQRLDDKTICIYVIKKWVVHVGFRRCPSLKNTTVKLCKMILRPVGQK